MIEARFLGNGSNAVVGLRAQQAHGVDRAQVVDVGLRRAVDRLVAEELDKAVHADAKCKASYSRGRRKSYTGIERTNRHPSV